MGSGADAGAHPVHALSRHHDQLSESTRNLRHCGDHASMAGTGANRPVDTRTGVAQQHRQQCQHGTVTGWHTLVYVSHILSIYKD